MRYQTNLMRAILTSETAREIIDWVSQLYGDSYVGLWVYQVLGVVLGEVRAMAEQLRQAVRPSTAEELLDLWEVSYGLTIGTGLTPEQRQARLAERKLTHTPASPAALERLVRTAYNCRAVVTEHTAPYTFAVDIYSDEPLDLNEVAARLRRIKPAQEQMDLYLIVAENAQAVAHAAAAVIAEELTDSAAAVRY